ncbi:MAG: DUF481 domain-containing protein [Pseudomonadota bacterium]
MSLFLVSVGASAFADTVVLKNGDQLTGSVDSIVSGRVLLQTEYAGLIPIQLDAVASIDSEVDLDVRTAGGVSSGRLAMVAGEQHIVSADASRPVALADVGRATKNKLSVTSFADEWSSRADLSAVISNGNSDTASYNTLVESSYKAGKSEHNVSLLVSKEEAEEETTKDTLDLDYGYKRFISEKWFASGNAEYFQDKLKDIDQRITLGAGMGYQFWDNSLGAFSTDLGISAVKEELNGDDETNPAIRWGLDYKQFFFSNRMELFHKQSLLFIPDSDRGEVISSSTGLRYALSDRIDSTVRVDLNHETEPPEGSSSTDVTYSLGIGVKF